MTKIIAGTPELIALLQETTTVAPVQEASTADIGLNNLFSGIIGAFLVFVFTVVYTEVREARQRVRDGARIARLLYQEVERNKPAVETGTQKRQEGGREVTK